MPGRSVRNVSDENRSRRNPVACGFENGGWLQSARHPPPNQIRTERRPPGDRDESFLTLGAGVTPAQGSVKPTAGFTTINRDDTRRQKVDHGFDAAVRKDKG